MEFYLDGPRPHPNRCVYCGETRGALMVSAAEIPGYGYILSCEACDRAKARIRGFSKGKRFDELVNASERLGELEKELADRDATIKKQLDDATALNRVIRERDEYIEFLRGKERQQEHLAGLLAENARQLIEVRGMQPVGA